MRGIEPTANDKKADLAGPGISTYEEVAKILPTDYEPVLDRKETQQALYAVKRYIEDGLARELNLMLVQVPLLVSEESGVNDMLDRDGSRTPFTFPCGLGQARTYMYLLRKAHLGEVTVSVWPKQLKEICASRNIHVLDQSRTGSRSPAPRLRRGAGEKTEMNVLTLKINREPVPLVVDGDGVIRVGPSRVTLDTVVLAFQDGATAEEIVQQYPSLGLGDVYSALGYYLKHESEVDAYMEERRRVAGEVREQNEARHDPDAIRGRLLSRRKNRE